MNHSSQICKRVDYDAWHVICVPSRFCNGIAAPGSLLVCASCALAYMSILAGCTNRPRERTTTAVPTHPIPISDHALSIFPTPSGPSGQGCAATCDAAADSPLGTTGSTPNCQEAKSLCPQLPPADSLFFKPSYVAAGPEVPHVANIPSAKPELWNVLTPDWPSDIKRPNKQ